MPPGKDEGENREPNNIYDVGEAQERVKSQEREKVQELGETQERQEVRRLLRPFLITLALTALLVVLLTAALAWTGRQIHLTEIGLAPHPSGRMTAQSAAGLQQRRAALAAAAMLLPAVLVPVILLLLAFSGFRAWASVQGLGDRFLGQIGLQKEQLDVLRRRHFLLSSTLSGVGDAVITADVSGRITFMNPVAEKLTAWQEVDALGREVKAVLMLVQEQTGAAMPDPATAPLADALRLDFPSHAVQVARTGERRPVSGSSTPLWEAPGKPGGIAVVFRDVSERRGAAETLQDLKTQRASLEARAEAILEAASDCIVLMRPGGEIAGFNPAAERVFGWTGAQAMGRLAASLLFPPSSRDTLQREAQRASAPDASSGRPQRVQTNALRADGREFPAEMTITRIPRQETPLFAIYLRDISDRRETEEALRRAQDMALTAVHRENREKSALLANMSDELRTPLNAILGYSEMLEEEAVDLGAQDFVPDLQKIHGAGKHLLSLINDILDLSKIEAGQMELYPETFDVAAMLGEVTQTVEPLLARNRNMLLVGAEGDLGVLYADRIKVKQSLLNVLSNAAGFSQGRTVSLNVSRERDPSGEWVTFRLADGSVDQSAPLHQQLLETDPALETSSAPRFSGHGLALVIARRFCQMQGGEWSGSREPGRGAVYQLRFPVKV